MIKSRQQLANIAARHEQYETVEVDKHRKYTAHHTQVMQDRHTHTAEIAAHTEYTTLNVGHTAANAGHTAAHIAQTAAYTGVIL
jgi:hypothetical protein